jgi:hypothetical protein
VIEEVLKPCCSPGTLFLAVPNPVPVTIDHLASRFNPSQNSLSFRGKHLEIRIRFEQKYTNARWYDLSVLVKWQLDVCAKSAA